MGLLAGQMMYRWKMGITGVTALVVAVTIGAMALGPWGQHRECWLARWCKARCCRGDLG